MIRESTKQDLFDFWWIAVGGALIIWCSLGCSAVPVRTGPSDHQIESAKATVAQAQSAQPLSALTAGPAPELVSGASSCEFISVESGPALLCGYAMRVGPECGIISVTAVGDGAKAAIVWTACKGDHRE